MKSVAIGANPICLTDNIDVISSMNWSINEQMFNHFTEWKEHVLWYRSETLTKMNKEEIVGHCKLKTKFKFSSKNQ